LSEFTAEFLLKHAFNEDNAEALKEESLSTRPQYFRGDFEMKKFDFARLMTEDEYMLSWLRGKKWGKYEHFWSFSSLEMEAHGITLLTNMSDDKDLSRLMNKMAFPRITHYG